MSHKIYKYALPVKEQFTLDLPRDAEIIRVDDVDGLFWLWAVVDTDPTIPTVTRYFENYKTGQEFKTHPEHLKYLGMVKMFIMQELALYVFENVCTVRPFKEKIPLKGSLDKLTPVTGPTTELKYLTPHYKECEGSYNNGSSACMRPVRHEGHCGPPEKISYNDSRSIGS